MGMATMVIQNSTTGIVFDNDQELHSECQEKEKIELEERDVNLIRVSQKAFENFATYLVTQVSFLQLQVRTDMFVD